LLFDNSLFLIGGAILALVWANLDTDSDRATMDFEVGRFLGIDQHDPVSAPDAPPANGEPAAEHHAHPWTVAFLVNDILMALFFALAAKEVWEARVPGGALSNPRRAATPLLATRGGLLGPALLYVLGAVLGAVLVGLLMGKFLGITLFTWIAEKWFRLEMPEGMTYRHVFTLGTSAGIGFTVALFMSDAAFPDMQFSSDLRDAVKMGALASFFAAVLALVVARVLRIERLVLSGKSPAEAAESTRSETEKNRT
jgi:hypothetical protein